MNNNYSIISENASIAPDAKIGRFCIIEDGVKLEDGVVVEDYVVIGRRSLIGSGTKIGTHSKVGENVQIGKNCSFTAYCEIRDECNLGNFVSMGSRGTLSAHTIVEDDVIMKYSFVATDTPVLKEGNLKKTCVLKKGSRYGANVTIMPAVTIGANSEIGACSQVRQDVPDGEIWYGNPAKFFKKVKG